MNWLKTRYLPSSGVEDGELHAADRVANVQKAPRLSAFAVDREQVSGGGLHAEAVYDRAEDPVEVEAGYESLVGLGLVGPRPIDDALYEVRAPEAPDLARQSYVVRVMHLGDMVEATGLLGEGQRVLAAPVLYLEEAFGDGHVGRTILAHRPELD